MRPLASARAVRLPLRCGRGGGAGRPPRPSRRRSVQADQVLEDRADAVTPVLRRQAVEGRGPWYFAVVQGDEGAQELGQGVLPEPCEPTGAIVGSGRAEAESRSSCGTSRTSAEAVSDTWRRVMPWSRCLPSDCSSREPGLSRERSVQERAADEAGRLGRNVPASEVVGVGRGSLVEEAGVGGWEVVAWRSRDRRETARRPEAAGRSGRPGGAAWVTNWTPTVATSTMSPAVAWWFAGQPIAEEPRRNRPGTWLTRRR